MQAGDWIAVYGAVVATGAVVWQALSAHADRRERVRVELSITHFSDGQPREGLGRNNPPDFGLGWRLDIEVANFGRAAIRVDRLGFETLQTARGLAHWSAADWGLPWLLESGETRSAFLTDDNAEALKPDQEFVAVVHTTRDHTFRSDVLQVRPGGKGRSLVMMQGEHFEAVAHAASRPTFVLEVHEFGSTGQTAS
jgi:hypothetical protein